MNNGYYQNPVFPGVGLNNNTIPNQQSVPSYEQSQTTVNPITSEQSYIENILRLNRGKKLNFMLLFLDLRNGKIGFLRELLNNQEETILLYLILLLENGT